MEHQDTRKLPRSAQEALRHRVVRAVVVKGMTQRAAARLYGVSENSVSAWVRAFGDKGAYALKTKRIGRPKGVSLTKEQAQSIRKRVVGKCPDQLRLAWRACVAISWMLFERCRITFDLISL